MDHKDFDPMVYDNAKMKYVRRSEILTYDDPKEDPAIEAAIAEAFSGIVPVSVAIAKAHPGCALGETNPKKAFGDKKPPVGLIPQEALYQQALAYKLGCDKYSPFNWRDHPVDTMTYVHAAIRHLTEYVEGRDIDIESGASPLAHTMSCCGIILDAKKHGTLVDNRPKPLTITTNGTPSNSAT